MKKVLSLCAGRHEMPANIEGSIFPNEVGNVFDFKSIRFQIAKALQKVEALDLYVTGLTVLTVEVIKYCVKNEIDLTLFHYNKESGDYIPQSVCKHVAWCNYCGCECPCKGGSQHCDCDPQTQYECGGLAAGNTFIVF